MNSGSRGAAVKLFDSGHRLLDKKFDIADGGSAVVDHSLISLVRLDVTIWRFARGG
jgi:hypothetical protein